MTVWCVGSINVDHVYAVPHLVRPGETLAADERVTMLGGKGANQSVAAAQLGAPVRHVGAVGPDGDAILAELAGYGVDVARVARAPAATGHAIVQVDAGGENAILLHAGANADVADHVADGLAGIARGDVLLLQNETSGNAQAARLARAAGARVLYSAAPFDAGAARDMLPAIDLLLLNEGEAADLAGALGDVALPDRIVTRGARGAIWHRGDAPPIDLPAHPVARVVDTTGAGDCFAGALAAGLDGGAPPPAAMQQAIVAAGLQVMRKGTAQAMPTRAEVEAASA